MRTVKLKKNEDRRVRAGHLWIFSNEIGNLGQEFKPGEIVDILSHAGSYIGRGYINPQSLISIRILTREREAIDEGFFAGRIARALALRLFDLLGFHLDGFLGRCTEAIRLSSEHFGGSFGD